MTMQATEILKRGKLQRYYKMRFLQAGGLSHPDAVFLDAKYYDMLSPAELLAVGAHEFNHIIEKHGVKRFTRIFGPTLAIAAIAGLITFADYGAINSTGIFSPYGSVLTSLFVVALSLVLILIASFYFNANWNRQQETQSDLAAVKFANGEALISALVKLNKLHPLKMSRLETRILPKMYPSLEQRINDIRLATKRKPQEQK